jgi:hypothetical protein
MNVPDAKYRCMKCGFEWSGYRVLWDEETGMGQQYRHNGARGMTECPRPKCKNTYVEWVNWDEVRVALGRYWER